MVLSLQEVNVVNFEKQGTVIDEKILKKNHNHHQQCVDFGSSFKINSSRRCFGDNWGNLNLDGLLEYFR